MTPGLEAALIMYYIAVSITAVIVAFYDRNEILKGRPGINDRNIILISLLGGALWMFLIFVLAKHRTRQPKIMVPLPFFIVIHSAIAMLLILKG